MLHSMFRTGHARPLNKTKAFCPRRGHGIAAQSPAKCPHRRARNVRAMSTTMSALCPGVRSRIRYWRERAGDIFVHATDRRPTAGRARDFRDYVRELSAPASAQSPRDIHDAGFQWASENPCAGLAMTAPWDAGKSWNVHDADLEWTWFIRRLSTVPDRVSKRTRRHYPLTRHPLSTVSPFSERENRVSKIRNRPKPRRFGECCPTGTQPPRHGPRSGEAASLRPVATLPRFETASQASSPSAFKDHSAKLL